MSKEPFSLSIGTAIIEGTQQLFEGAVAEPRRESSSLLAHVLRRDRSFVIAHFDEELTGEQYESFRSMIQRRAAGEPLQYITQHQEFFKLDFAVTADVLIPRPETEIVIETALELLGDDPEAYVADIGTGSGCLAVSILHELSTARAVASDVSPAALQVAQGNAERHGVSNRLALVRSDCFSALDAKRRFSLIVSNPPYVSDDEMKDLQREVRYEPRLALAGGPDGLSIIRRLLIEAPPFLLSGGYLVFEIGFGQKGAVEKLIDRGLWNLVEIRADLQQIPRTFILQRK